MKEQNYLNSDDEAIVTQACENLNKIFGDEKLKLVKTEKATICDINMVIFLLFYLFRYTRHIFTWVCSTTVQNVGTILKKMLFTVNERVISYYNDETSWTHSK